MARHVTTTLSTLLLATALAALSPEPGQRTVAPAHAGTYAFKLAGASVPLAIPDSWQVSGIKNGIQVTRPDQEVFVWLQTATQDSIGPLMDEYKSYFAKQGVTFSGVPKSEEHDLGSATALDIRFDAKWKGSPTVVVLSVVTRKANPAGTVLIGYWASPKADKESDPQMGQLLGSLIAP
ncbi:hypothetical protein [uncultured Alsobacter sp.]|uniref:hypothetical protein n=1 Tax=uncultured Alsobacter sp. TaxID=1748258 RepID=UPI0025DE05E1|nr:hypothetical protein [uncultured Alsobacter sp.]